MKFSRKRKKLGGIPTSSMSDVAFLLLVFFLATTQFDMKKGLGLVLPPASKQANKKMKLKEENITKIWINESGKILLKTPDLEETVTLRELKKSIRKIVSNNPDMVISLKTDRRSQYRYMVKALDRIQAAGAEKISLSTN